MTELRDRAQTLLDLHTAPEILTLPNVWDVASAQAVAGVEGVRALATASHAIANAFGYEDGENIPLDLHLEMVERITRAVDLPLSMDFEAGYGHPGETARRAIAAGVVMGVARVSTGPFTQYVALNALREAAAAFVGGGSLPAEAMPPA